MSDLRAFLGWTAVGLLVVLVLHVTGSYDREEYEACRPAVERAGCPPVLLPLGEPPRDWPDDDWYL